MGEPQLQLALPKLDNKWVFPRFVKKINIAVSDDVRLTALEQEIIDTPEFQRLKWIRQLGAAIQVYPTAVHTRFDHSLGTLALTDRMITAINDAANNSKAGKNPTRISPEQRAIARLYALLHDITHIPFGHTLEDELGIFVRHDSRKSKRIEHFLGENSTIGRLIQNGLSVQTYERFFNVVTKGKNGKLPHNDEFVFHLVSDTVCADLLDYLSRDSLFCNLELSIPHRFLDYLEIREIRLEQDQHDDDLDDVPPDRNSTRFRPVVRLWKGKHNVPRREILTDLGRLVEARYMLAERVYFHHTKIIVGTMIGRAVLEEKKAGGIEEGKKLYDFADDTLIYHLINHAKSPMARQLARDYHERRLYKLVKQYKKSDFSALQENDHNVRIEESVLESLRNPDFRYDRENEIAKNIGVDAGLILLYPPPRNMNSKPAQINVLWEGGYRPLCEIDDEVLRPKLDANLQAHSNLWGISLIAHPSLTPLQMDDARKLFEALNIFKGEGDEISRKRIEILEGAARNLIESRPDIPSMKPQDLAKLVRQSAREFDTVRNSGREDSADLDNIISRILQTMKR